MSKITTPERKNQTTISIDTLGREGELRRTQNVVVFRILISPEFALFFVILQKSLHVQNSLCDCYGQKSVLK